MCRPWNPVAAKICALGLCRGVGIRNEEHLPVHVLMPGIECGSCRAVPYRDLRLSGWLEMNEKLKMSGAK